VNAALREIADRRRRAVAVERMRQMVAEGEIDFSAIEKPADTAPLAAGASSAASDAEHHASDAEHHAA
jgi:hypothetical protein